MKRKRSAEDVRTFIQDTASLALWSADFFKQITDRLKQVKLRQHTTGIIIRLIERKAGERKGHIHENIPAKHSGHLWCYGD